MASIAKQPNRRFWYASYRDAKGAQHCVSTKIKHAPDLQDPKERAQAAANNRRLAQDIANKLEEAERGNAVESHLRKILADISQRVNSRRIEFACTETFLADWLGRVKKTKSPATAERYGIAVTAFLESLGPKASAALADITAQDIQAFIEARLTGGRNPTTVAVDLKALNVPFALAMRQGLILNNPVPAADAPRAEKERREPFTWEQIQAIIRAAAGEWKTAILFGAFTGQRLGDSISMTWGAVDFEQHLLKFRPQKTRASKKDLVLPLHPDLETHLLDLPAGKPSDPICPTLSQADIGGRRGLSRQFLAIVAKAGIAQQSIAAGGKAGHIFNRYGFHSLRHSFVSMLANAGIAADVRQLLSGHADEKSHAIYTHTSLDTLKRAVHTLPRLTL